MKITVIEPHGMCAGVNAAIRKALQLAHDAADANRPVYCLHELVHNELVVGDLKQRGFRFVENLAEIPEGSTVLFSAHGVSPSVRAEARKRKLTVVDATCPFVGRVHAAARQFAERGLDVVIIGKSSHAEVKGIAGEIAAVNAGLAHQVRTVYVGSIAEVEEVPVGRYGVVSQTTMNADEVAEIVEELRKRSVIESVAEVCNATKVRQDAVKSFCGDAVLVLGSANSSNTKRLCEVARVKSFRAATIDELLTLDFSGVTNLGVTSGASTPENFFSDALARLNG